MKFTKPGSRRFACVSAGKSRRSGNHEVKFDVVDVDDCGAVSAVDFRTIITIPPNTTRILMSVGAVGDTDYGLNVYKNGALLIEGMLREEFLDTASDGTRGVGFFNTHYLTVVPGDEFYLRATGGGSSSEARVRDIRMMVEFIA